MKALWSCRSIHDPGARGWASPRRWVLVPALLLLLLPAVAGCNIVEELTVTSQPVGVEAPTPATSTTATILEVATATTAVPRTTTTTEPPTTTTTTEPATTTTTTEPDIPTTTVLEDTGTTVTESTTTTEPADTTVPTTVETETPEETETVLYEITDWSEGTSGWAAAGQWKTAGGMLVADGSSDSFAVAPVDLTGYPDYVVECEIQILEPEGDIDVFLIARMINGRGLWGGFDSNNTRMKIGYGRFGKTSIARVDFDMDGDWHQYRLEVRGNSLKLYFEEAEVARAMDNRALEAGTVGIYCGNGQINVRSFRVIAL
jgi:hypothetical protein